MILDTSPKVLRIVLGEGKTTSDCPITTAWAETSSAAFLGGNTNILSNGTTPVVVVATPSNNTVVRDVREVRLYNADTVSHTVTLQLYDGTTAWPIAPAAVTVPAGGAFVYTPAAGITVSGGGPLGVAGGDLSGSYPTPTVAKVDGVSYPSSPATNTFPLVTGANTVTYTATSQIPGSTTNDSASAGNIGEYITSTVLAGAAVGVSNLTATNITSISPTGGDWDVSGNVAFAASTGGTSASQMAYLSTASATLPTFPNSGGMTLISALTGASLTQVIPTGAMRQSLSTTTAIYLEGYAGISAGTLAGYGFIGARRRR